MFSFALAMAIGVLPTDPNDVYESAAVDLDSVPLVDRQYVRWVSLWPASLERRDSLSAALSSWGNSITWSPQSHTMRMTEDGALWRIDLRQWGWSKEAWESLASGDAYFAVTTKNAKGEIQRGWLDPRVEGTVRYATGSSKAVLRADYFLARTSLDGKKADGFFREGYYSQFLNLPKTDKELKELLGAKDKVKVPSSGYDVFVFLLKGGAVTESQVAQHNRGLQVQKTLIGRDESFIWESLDTDSNTGESSVFKALAGTLKRAGGEFIFTLPNGNHGYYACNAKGEKVSEVPINIAQDKGHPRESVVLLGWKCAKCHWPNGGINGFDDVVSPLIVGKGTALAVISKGKEAKDADELKQRNEAYYLGDLKGITKRHRESFTSVLLEQTEMAPDEAAKNYLEWVEGYLYQPVTRDDAIRETGFGDEFDKYAKLTSPESNILPLVNKQRIPREQFEEDFARLMQAKVWPWEVKP